MIKHIESPFALRTLICEFILTKSLLLYIPVYIHIISRRDLNIKCYHPIPKKTFLLFIYYIRAFDFPNRQIYTDCIIHTNYECTDEFSQFYKRGEHKYNQQVILQIDFSQSANLEVTMPDL